MTSKLAALPFLLLTAFSVSGCFPPKTVEQCQQKADPRDARACIEDRLYSDAGVGALAGAAVGAIVGAAAGSSHGGGGIAIGAGSGALVGGAAGGIATYYIENKQASAIADVVNSNYQLQAAVDTIKMEDERLRLSLATAESERNTTRQQFQDLQTRNREQIAAIDNILARQQSELSNYRLAVRTKWHSIPPDIQAELDRRQAQILELTRERDAGQLRELQLHQQLDAVS